MNWRKDIWTYLLVTLVAVLIWFWAAGETRERTDPMDALVQFTVADPENWVIRPSQHSVRIVIEGSQMALQKARSRLRQPLTITISPTRGQQTIDLTDRVGRHEDLLATGVNVQSVDPADVIVELDNIERFAVAVKAALPGVSTEGEVVIEPREVEVAMPSQMRQRITPTFAVEAALEKAELDRLQPGIAHTQEAKLRIPTGDPQMSSVTITPSHVKLTFTIRSRERETRLQTVRVQLAGPPEDRETYDVEIDPKQLPDVTITADADLIRRIEANEATVVAVLHVGSREKEARIESKRITYFLALVPEPGGGTRGEVVRGRFNNSTEMPLIRLRITPRTQP